MVVRETKEQLEPKLALAEEQLAHVAMQGACAASSDMLVLLKKEEDRLARDIQEIKRKLASL